MVRDMVEHDKPLAYVLGSQPFHPLPVDLVVRAPILVPRPETEHWVLHLSETILSTATLANDRPFRILDLGTGTGCIALGLTQSLVTSNRFPSVSTLAIDQSNEAVTLARENVERCKLEPSVQVVKLDLFDSDFAHRVVDDREGGHQRFNLVVSNPPYITRTEFESLDPSVKNWEDRAALVGERPSSTTGSDLDDGLIFYHKIASMLDDLLVPGRDELGPGPHVAFEVGKGQARAVETLLSERGFKSEIVSDPWGIERAVFAWKL
ncbi:S-adenosylmethionine-dependent methyltransferase [Sporobolomyces koalae]|uniref:S-adenosylmethionine-dependent methyltransferase n=1 Tax=Sporobolomyces koalae TaxID=500713 RepID=UPI00317283E9